MDIEGLDYNTQREKLILPEYGREVQNMVDYALTITDRQERQHCAETIVSTMARMFPQNKESEEYLRKLWDHLAWTSIILSMYLKQLRFIRKQSLCSIP